MAAALAAVCGGNTAARCSGSCAAPTPPPLRLRGGFDVAVAQADYVREVMEVAAHPRYGTACARPRRLPRRPRVASA